MEHLKILIVEDEILTSNRIKRILERKGYIVTAVASNKKSAIEAMMRNPADLILMDINLNGKIDGIVTAKTIKNSYPVPVIYITEISDEEIFQKAKETFPKNYITKPFIDQTILHAVELALQQPGFEISENIGFDQIGLKLTDRIFIQTKEGVFIKLLLEDIIYVAAKGAYSSLHFNERDNEEDNFYHFSQSSNNLVERLIFPGLIRVHKSFYVNAYRIEAIRNAEILLKGSKTLIPVSRDFRKELDKLLIYLKHNPPQK